MEDFTGRPDQRVFHVDQECYVIYLGARPDSYRPFLRIGNSESLPAEVVENTHSIVVTDRLTGNPMFEAEAIRHMDLKEITYLGDPVTVGHFRDFVGQEDLPTESYEEYSREEAAPREKAYVYFYRGGNMSVYYGGDKVFDLEKRERADVHYVEATRRIKNEFLKNPLRYGRQLLEGPGLARAGGVPVFFYGGRLMAASLVPDWFRRVSAAGFDPDAIVGVGAEHVTEPLIELFKRKRAKDAHLTVFTSNPEEIRRAANLFSNARQESLRVDVRPFHAAEDFVGHTVEVGPAGTLKVYGGKLGYHLAFGELGESRNKTQVQVYNRELTVFHRGTEGRYALLDDTPVTFLESLPPARAAITRYLSNWVPVLRDMVSESSIVPAEQLDRLLTRRPGGKAGEQLAKSIAERLRHEADTSPIVLREFYVYAASLLSFLMREHSPGLGKAGENLRAALNRAGADQARARPSVPVALDLAVGEHGGYLLARPVSTTMSAQNVAYAAEVRNAIEEAGRPDEETYQHERERLHALVEQLAIPAASGKSGVASRAEGAGESAETGRESEPSGERRDSEPSPRTGKQEAAGESAAKRETAAADTAALGAADIGSGPTPPGARESGRSGRRWPWVAAAVLALLIVAMLGLRPWDTEGPWGTVASALGLEEPVEVVDEPEPPAEPVDPEEPDEVADPVDPEPPDDELPEVEEAPEPDDPEAVDPTEPVVPDDPEEPEVEEDPEVLEPDPDPEAPPPAVTPEPEEIAPEPEVQLEELDDPRDLAVDVTDVTAVLHDDFRYGTIGVTDVDLIRVTNMIATASGYRALGEDPEVGPNPDWIHPGNRLVLPDSAEHTVQGTDSIWWIAAGYLNRHIARTMVEYADLLSGVDPDEIPQEEREQVVAQLRELHEAALSAEMRDVLSSAISLF